MLLTRAACFVRLGLLSHVLHLLLVLDLLLIPFSSPSAYFMFLTCCLTLAVFLLLPHVFHILLALELLLI